MRISGFTILRNAVRLDYPFEASIRSLLPLVDEMIVGVGDGDDGTWEAVAAIGDPKIKAFRSVWGSPRPGGAVLSEQTNLALARCQGDWAMYLQADEVVHENDLDRIRAAMQRHLHSSVEGLLFRYHHFIEHHSRESDCWITFYRRAVRAIKTGIDIHSVGDAAGFARTRGARTRGLIKADCGAWIYHYGWCNPRDRQIARLQNLRAFYPDEAPLEITTQSEFWNARARIFSGTHPAVMQARIDTRPIDTPIRQSMLSPAMRAAVAVARGPLTAVRGWARPLLPVTLTNWWWRLDDARR